jgi:uncharacterized membrane protein YfcA
VTGYGVYRLIVKASTKSVSRWWGIPTGLFGGLVGGLFSVRGPIYAAYMTARIPDHAPHCPRFFLCSTGFRLLVFLLSGLMLQKEVWWGLLLLVASMLIGLTIGHRRHAKLFREQVGGLISVLLVISGLSLLWKALWFFCLCSVLSPQSCFPQGLSILQVVGRMLSFASMRTSDFQP